jgi:hypothetical protein
MKCEYLPKYSQEILGYVERLDNSGTVFLARIWLGQ